MRSSGLSARCSSYYAKVDLGMAFSWRCMADPEDNEFCLYLMAPGLSNDA